MQPRETHAGHIIQETLHYWRQDIFPAMDMSVLHHIKSLQLQAPASQMPVFAPHSTEENENYDRCEQKQGRQNQRKLLF